MTNRYISVLLGGRPMRRFSPYIFGVLVVGLAMHPYVVQMMVHSAWQPYVEGAANLFIVTFGVLTYLLYERERRESDERFLESSVYIGAMNRKLPLLQQITTDVISGNVATAKQKTEVFQKLLSIACGTVANTDRGVLRFIEVKTGRTVKEFRFVRDEQQSHGDFVIGNKELLRSESFLRGRTKTLRQYVIVATSDRIAAVRTFLVIPRARKEMSEHLPTIQAIVDQGQVLSRYLFGELSQRYA